MFGNDHCIVLSGCVNSSAQFRVCKIHMEKSKTNAVAVSPLKVVH